LFDLKTGKVVRTFPGLPWVNRYHGVVIGANGRAAYCDQSGRLHVLDTDTGKIVHSPDQVWRQDSSRRLALSADGRRVVVATGVQWLSDKGKMEGQVLVYDLLAGQVIADVRIDGY